MNGRGLLFRLSRAVRADRRFKMLGELVASERLPLEKLQAMQAERLRSLLRHAYHTVPFYRDALRNCGVVCRDGREIDLEAFGAVPLLDRKVIRANLRELVSQAPRARSGRRYFASTGGTTGEPLRIMRDGWTDQWAAAAQLWFDSWSGYRVGEPKVVLAFHHRLAGAPLRFGKLRRGLGRWLRGEVWLDCLAMSEETMGRYVAVINQLRPVQLYGYSDSMAEIARFILRKGISVHRPTSIVVSSTLLYPDMRTQIEQAFGARVWDRYGSHEAPKMASECEVHDGLHLSMLGHYVEVLRPDGCPAGPGEVGELVITPLTNFSMPLIRYRIGDLGSTAPGPCLCGRTLPRLQMIEGRTLDRIVGRGGTLVHGFSLRVPLFRDWVAKFQIIQETEAHIRVRIVEAYRTADPLRAYKADLAEITRTYRDFVGHQCVVTFEFTDDIASSPGTKFRSVVSKVSASRSHG